MPIWLRTFTFNKMKDFFEKEQEQMDEKNKQLTNKNVSKIARPDIPTSSTYNAKVPTK